MYDSPVHPHLDAYAVGVLPSMTLSLTAALQIWSGVWGTSWLSPGS